MRPVFEQRAFRAPRGFVEESAIVHAEPREQRQIVRPHHDADRIDLEKLGRRNDTRERLCIGRASLAVEPLGCECSGSRFVQR